MEVHSDRLMSNTFVGYTTLNKFYIRVADLTYASKHFHKNILKFVFVVFKIFVMNRK